MDAQERDRFADAFAFVLAHHAGQTRKGGDVPYVSHLVQVAGLVLEHGGDAVAATAALLHDVVEDCDDVSSEDVHGRFGSEVATIVDHCTDLLEGDRVDVYLRNDRFSCTHGRLLPVTSAISNVVRLS